MPIYVDYSSEQYDIINIIQKQGYYEGIKTRLLLLMSTNNYARTISDLAGILCEYPGLSNQNELIRCIELCIKEGFLKTRDSLGISICYQDKECLEKFLAVLPDEICTKILHYRQTYLNSSCVTVLGLLSGGKELGFINSSFLQRLQEARSEILLPMLNTSPNENVIKILRERAEAGVQVKILLADYKKVVRKIRGGKDSTLEQWANSLEGVDNIEIRVYNKIADSNIYSSVVIDRVFCRICVFDNVKEKSSNGTLIELTKNGYDLNLTNIIADRFNEIWLRSRPVTTSKIAWFLQDKRCWLFAGILVCIPIYQYSNDAAQDVILNIIIALGGSLLTLLYENIGSAISSIYRWLKRKQ